MIAYAVNNYVWNLLQDRMNWKKIDGLVPMMPAQQQPEFQHFDKPHIAYGFTNEYNTGEVEAKDSTVIHYVIYSYDVEQIDETIELLKNAFKSFSSADNLNFWFRSPRNPDIAVKDRDERVMYTEVMDTISAGNASEEGGRQNGYISIRVGYKTEPDDYSL